MLDGVEIEELADDGGDGEVGVRKGKGKSLGAALESVEVAIEEEGVPAMDADGFEEAVAVEESAVEEGDGGFFGGEETTVEEGIQRGRHGIGRGWASPAVFWKR